MKDLTLDQTNHWLDCLNFLMKNGSKKKNLDELYIELMERYTTFQELIQLGLVSYS